MARVFISHSGKDSALAGQVHGWLVQERHDVFLDRHPKDGIAVGDDWQQRLHEQLRLADAVVCLVTSSYVASPWCAAEVGVAQSRGSRVLPLLAEPGVIHPLLKSVQYVPISLGSDTARAKLVEALRRIDAVGGWGWPDNQSPFPGLQPFDLERRRVFFGRAAEVNALGELLRSAAHSAEPAVVLVVGPSGCGKSSLVRAGLVPVMAEEPGWLTVPPMLPGADPIAGLSRELAAAASTNGLVWAVAHVRDRLQRKGGLIELADELMLAAPPPRPRKPLLVIDQLEELLTQAPDGDRCRFVELLRPALAGPVQVVATLRPDFLDRLLATPQLAALPTHTFILQPLTREALAAVIEEPARLAGIGIEKDLVHELVNDTDSGEALPLLAYTLAQLADDIKHGDRLLMSRYQQLGGVRGTLARSADAALAQATRNGVGRDEVIRWLLGLVTVDEQGRPTRWRVPRNELPDEAAAALESFVTRRLLVTDQRSDNATDQRSDGPTLEVAHEAFLTAWTPLSEAVTANATALRARRAVQRAAEEWSSNGRNRALLWERGQLAAAMADTGARLEPPAAPGDPPLPTRSIVWCRTKVSHPRVVVTDRVDLSAKAREFLRESVRRDRWRRGRISIFLAAALAIVLVAASVTFVQLRQTEQQQQIATARLLLARAEAIANNDPRTALRLGEAAAHIHSNPETESSLAQLLRSTPYAGSLTGLRGEVQVAFARDRPLLATGDGNGSVSLWDFTDSNRPRRIGKEVAGHSHEVSAMALAPDGNTLVTSDYFSVVVWDVSGFGGPRRIGDLAGSQFDGLTSLAFAPDGRTLAVSTGDSSVRLWDFTAPAEPLQIGRPLIGDPPDEVGMMVFAPDGRTLATDGSAGTLLWDVSDRAHPRRVSSYLAGKHSPSFSADGRTFATVDDRGPMFWDVTTSNELHRIDVSPATTFGPVGYVAFAPGGRVMATVRDDGTLFWDISDRSRPNPIGSSPFTGGSGSLVSLGFSPDGDILATGGSDGTVALWNVTDPTEPHPTGSVLTGAASPASFLAFTPEGRSLTASFSSSALQWDLTDPARPHPVSAPLDFPPGYPMALAQDGKSLATDGGDNGRILIWRLTELDPIRGTLNGQTYDTISAIAFSADGHSLAMGKGSGVVVLWDLTDPSQPRRIGTTLGLIKGASAIAFAPDGNTLATGNPDGTTVLWDITDPSRPRRIGSPLAGHVGAVSVVAFSPDGRTLATGGRDDGNTLLWEIANLAQPQRVGIPLASDTGVVNDVAFAFDGRAMATVSGDHAILWDLTDLTRPRPIGSPLSPAFSVAFSPDRRIMATAGNSDVTLWDLTGLYLLRDDVLGRACSITHGGLGQVEWSRYVDGLQYEDSCIPASSR